MKPFASLFCCMIALHCYAQTQKKVASYLFAQYNHTLYDYTINNNPWGAGLGIQLSLNNKTKWKPTIELTGDLYGEDDKVLRLNPDGAVPADENTIDGMVNLFAGASFHPTKSIYISFTTGPSFIGKQTHLAIKPSVGLFFSKKQRWTGKLSYINVFNRTNNEDFGSLSLAVGFRLF